MFSEASLLTVLLTCLLERLRGTSELSRDLWIPKKIRKPWEQRLGTNVFISPVWYGQCRIINVCEIPEELGTHYGPYLQCRFLLLYFTENYINNSQSLRDKAN